MTDFMADGTEWRTCPAQGIAAKIPQAAGIFAFCGHFVVHFYLAAQLYKTGGRGIAADSPVGRSPMRPKK
ncbi:MAG: hypothetical protein LBL36_07060 [Clostridiales Family XIII bacterium]|jgi:hypothetical protein|nr:hypothetical protein [Clostridiales Family XIII bacterium]